ncbi:hypothetical protein GQ42DRAFT_179373 [Ramicandelaber brevisporus]|nr:hypothetical protein GQ42DRAFT_179373 [Ramicandelaber brevisporus]
MSDYDNRPRGEMLPVMAPSTFQVECGEIVWGQLQSVMHGYHAEGHDISRSPDENWEGGTVVTHGFKFKCAARNGEWQVKKIMATPKRGNGAEDSAGFIFLHSDIDAEKVLDDAMKVNFQNRLEQSDIVFVNRYDWNYYHSLPVPKNLPNLGDDKVMDDDMTTHRIMFYDKVNVFKEGHGVHIPASGEYIYGRLMFSGKKHETFEQSDELVAFVFENDRMLTDCHDYCDFSVEDIDGTETFECFIDM